MRYEPPGTRSIREANEAEKRSSAALHPVTWEDVLRRTFLSAVLFAIPFLLQSKLEATRWSPFAEIASFLGAIGYACAAIASWRGVRKGWSEKRTETAGFTLGCWVFGLPVALALVVWLWSVVSGALSGAPGWAVVIIVLLIALLFR